MQVPGQNRIDSLPFRVMEPPQSPVSNTAGFPRVQHVFLHSSSSFLSSSPPSSPSLPSSLPSASISESSSSPVRHRTETKQEKRVSAIVTAGVRWFRRRCTSDFGVLHLGLLHLPGQLGFVHGGDHFGLMGRQKNNTKKKEGIVSSDVRQPNQTLPNLTLPNLTKPNLTKPNLTKPYLTLLNLTKPYQT